MQVPDVMLPNQVDGVFVGGGHNSLVAASYLARAGVSVLVLEATDKIGGGMTTDEVTLPLFRHNLHAHFVRWQPDNPVWGDLRIDRFGVRMIFPEVQDAIVFDGGQRALMHYRDPARSKAALARISKADADSFERLYEEWGEITSRVITPLRFAVPLPPEEEKELLARSRIGRSYLELASRAALDLIHERFETEPARILVAFNAAVRGYQPVLDLPGTGHAAVLAVPAASAAQLVAGGSGEIGRGLAAGLYEAGGAIATGARVAAIDVSAGRVRGVTLEDGRRIRVGRFVASSVPAPLSLLELVGRQHLDASLVKDLEAYRWNSDYALFGFHLALRERPRFHAEREEPEVATAHDISLGYETARDLVDEIGEVRAGMPGDIRVQTTIPSVHDPTQAPPGHHVAFGWKVVAPGSDDRDSMLARIVQRYTDYAPNLAGALLAAAAHTPADIARRFESMPGGDHLHGSFHPANTGFARPHPSLSGFRTPIDGLYLCGSSQHPGGGFSGAPGFIAAGVIAQDLDLPPWWSPLDARKVLRALEE